MATLQEIQERIDNNTLEPENLTVQQREAIDTMIDAGELRGPKMGNLIDTRNQAREDIALQKTEKLQPFTTATGVDRGDVEMVGEFAGGVIPFIKDKDLLVKEIQTLGFKSQFGMSPQGLQALEARKFHFDKYEKLYSRLPIVRNVKMLAKTGAVIGRMRDGFRAMIKAGPTQLLNTEAKSVMASAGGAAVGSISYDAANFATDFAVANKEDMARVKDADVEKLDAPSRMLVNALEATSNAALFNAGAFALGPMFSAMGAGVKGILGLGGEDAVRIARYAKETGTPTNFNAMINENAGFLAKGLKNFLNTFGIFPLVAGPGARNQLKIQQQTYEAFLDALNNAPYANAEMLGYAGIKEMRDNFARHNQSIGAMYEEIMAKAQIIGKDMQLIPTTNIKKSAEGIVETFNRMYKGMNLTGAKTPFTELDDPMLDFMQRIKDFTGSYYRGEGITAENYIGLNRALTKAYQNTKMYDARDLLRNFKHALELDFNSATSRNNIENLLKSDSFKKLYDTTLAEQGQEAADQLVRKTTKNLLELDTDLKATNKVFTEMIRPYIYGKTARDISKVDSKIFSNTGLMGVVGGSTINRDEAWGKAFKVILKNGSADAIKDMQFMLGMNTGSKQGKELFDRFRNLYFFDAFQSAFKQRPKTKVEAGLLDDLIEEGAEKGVVRPYIDDITGTRVGDTIDVEKYVESGIGTRQYKELKFQAEEVANFDVRKFKENLGLVGDDAQIASAKRKLIQMYGGGKQGVAGFDKLNKIIEVMEANASFDIGDVSRFLKRRLTLGGSVSGGIIAGAGIGGGGAVPMLAFMVLSRMTGDILTNPKYMDVILQSVDPMLRKEALTKSAQLSKRRQLAIVLNDLFEERKDAPEVDPDLINADEISDYLKSKGPMMPVAKFNAAAIAKPFRDRFFQEDYFINSASSTDQAIGRNFINGTAKAADLERKIEEAVQTSPATTQPTQPVQPTQPIAPVGQGQQQAVQQAQNYGALFPGDFAGQAIANRQVGQS